MRTNDRDGARYVRAGLRFLGIIYSLAICSSAQGPAQGGLEETLRLADQRRQEYVDAFRNFTAVETRVTELLDKDGGSKDSGPLFPISSCIDPYSIGTLLVSTACPEKLTAGLSASRRKTPSSYFRSLREQRRQRSSSASSVNRISNTCFGIRIGAARFSRWLFSATTIVQVSTLPSSGTNGSPSMT